MRFASIQPMKPGQAALGMTQGRPWGAVLW
jgi:hypothetical protein